MTTNPRRPENSSASLVSTRITRRQFGKGLASLAALATLRPLHVLAGPVSVTPDQARELYSHGIVIDALASPSSFNVPWPPLSPLSTLQLENAARSGITAVNLTVDAGGNTYKDVLKNISFWKDQVRAHSSQLLQVRNWSDLTRARRESKLGLIFGYQGPSRLGGKIKHFDESARLGVLIIQLTYNDSNLLGDGCLVPDDRGLKPFGREVVRRLNKLGVAVDLSHCSTKTTADAIALSAKPVLITHSGCREVARHPRSKEDRELRALAERGGVIGIYMMPFLGERTQTMLLRHIEHALNVCGADHVGIGSDLSITPVEETPEYLQAHQAITASRRQSGNSAPGEGEAPYIPELNQPRRLELIAVALARRGHSASVIEKVIGSNFHRVLGEIWGTS